MIKFTKTLDLTSGRGSRPSQVIIENGPNGSKILTLAVPSSEDLEMDSLTVPLTSEEVRIIKDEL